jgi:tRNA/tmRNA/rRNA uracil-C5-methylase (TrmA/RlmC/RlmD family)
MPAHARLLLCQSLAPVAESLVSTDTTLTTADRRLWSGFVSSVIADFISRASGGLPTESGQIVLTSSSLYTSKAARSEREKGCENIPAPPDSVHNNHPTVKPISLMRWLVKLVGGQPGSVIIDPFCGSGTTGCAAVLEGFRFVGIDQMPEYVEIARGRIKWWSEQKRRSLTQTAFSFTEEGDVP